VDVISDLLQMLKQQMTHSHSEYLEWIGISPLISLSCGPWGCGPVLWPCPVYTLTAGLLVFWGGIVTVVIILIAAEIFIALVNILVDALSGA